jgi:acetyltransferase-like isoleucine patch superfamily enzyme
VIVNNGDNNKIELEEKYIGTIEISVKGNNNNININSSVITGTLVINVEGNGHEIIISENVLVSDILNIFVIDNYSKIFIGERTTFEETSIAIADDNNSIVIGKDCMFARKTSLIASDFHSIIDINSGKRINFATGIHIGDHVWIGGDVKVLKNSNINLNSVIASNAVVSGNIPSNCIAGGLPAKVIKKDITWERERIKENKEDITIEDIDFSNVKNSMLQISNLDSTLFLEDGKIFGWSFLKNVESQYSNLCLEITYRNEEKKIVSTGRIDRQDVANYFKSNLYIHSGFYAILPRMNEEITSIRVIIKNNGDFTANELYRNSFTVKSFIKKVNPFR